VINYT